MPVPSCVPQYGVPVSLPPVPVRVECVRVCVFVCGHVFGPSAGGNGSSTPASPGGSDYPASPKGGDGKGAGGTGGGAASSAYSPDPETKEAIVTTVASILSKLVMTEEVEDAVGSVVNYAHALRAGTAELEAAVRRTPAAIERFAVAGVEPGQLVTAVLRLGMFADTESAKRVGSVALNSGAAACVDVVQSALIVARLRTEVETGGVISEPGAMETEVTKCLPLAIRTVRQILAAMGQSGGDVTSGGLGAGGVVLETAVTAVPLLISALELVPQIATETLQCLNVLTRHAEAAGTVAAAGGGRGIQIIVAALRRAEELADEAGVAAAMRCLVAVALLGDREVAAIDACGATGIVLSLLGDQTQDAPRDTLESTLTLLSTLARLGHVPAAAMSANVLQLLRVILGRFCRYMGCRSAVGWGCAAFVLLWLVWVRVCSDGAPYWRLLVVARTRLQ